MPAPRGSPRSRGRAQQADGVAPAAYLDEYLSTLRGDSAATREDALRREIGALSALIQASAQVPPGGNSGAPPTGTGPAGAAAGATTTSAASGARTAPAGNTRAGTGAVPAAPAAPAAVAPRTAASQAPRDGDANSQQQRATEVMIAKRFARFFMERLLQRVGGREASLNSLTSAQLNTLNSYKRLVADQLRQLLEEHIDYHTYRRALRELFSRATRGEVPDLWGDFVRIVTAQRPPAAGGSQAAATRAVSSTTPSRSAAPSAPAASASSTPRGGGGARGRRPRGGSAAAAKQPSRTEKAPNGAEEGAAAATPPVHRDAEARQPAATPSERSDADDDNYVDVDRMAHIDLEQERALLESEVAVTAVQATAPEQLLLDVRHLLRRMLLPRLHQHGDMRMAKQCVAMVSLAAEERLRDVLEGVIRAARIRREQHLPPGTAPQYTGLSVAERIRQEQDALERERARKRIALGIEDDAEHLRRALDADAKVRQRLAEDARHREKVKETNVALSGMLAHLTAARRKRAAPSASRETPEPKPDGGGDARGVTGAANAPPTATAPAPATALTHHATPPPPAQRIITLRDVLLVLQHDPLCRKSRFIHKWRWALQRVPATHP
ncbi:hypothetical protein CDCA_CDCA11G3276 [Cyanidium caldarium]|uniref:Transcription initiation factor TFIID component TAF4 C-terminal domain-containing protein n=1 Tax=Cyanidium caldarium TaxID=2771 RepID=A0AAV9IYU1_CYACA|nr:hypothetical protein CDCA_CDCA11G3276 [Cyanidium caldarium]